jgi:small-conductance mechanosensitive channel
VDLALGTPVASPAAAAAEVAAAAVGVVLLRRLGHRLPLVLTRRVLGAATHPDPAFRRLVAWALAPLQLGLGVAVAWDASGRLPGLRRARDAAVAALASGFGMPLFTVNDRGWTLVDVLALPLVLGALWVGVGVVARLVQSRALGASGMEHGAPETLAALVRYVGTLVGALVVLQAWGLDVRTLAVVGSVLGVGIGFGLQHLASNFVSGLVLSIERPVKPGDYVRIGDFQGTVERIGARSTEIVTRDRVSILVPNARLLEQEVINWSHGDPVCRIEIPVGVAYGSDVRAVRTALLDAAAGHPDVLQDRRARVELRRFGDSALEFALEVWIADPRRQQDVASDLNYRLEAALRRHGVEIPFPQRDLHLRDPALRELLAAVARRSVGDDDLAAARAFLAERGAARGAGPDLDAVDAELGRRAWDDAALAALAARMHAPDGVPVLDRRHLLTVYPRCFVGREAIDWLVACEGLSRAEARAVGARLVERGFVRHVLDEHPFRDGHFFYRFAADEDRPAPAAPLSRTGSRG